MVLAGKHSSRWILEADIKGCFDHISHEWLLENIPINKKVLKQWLTCGFVKDKHWFPTKEGTPQGGIISPTLANMALDGLEKVVNRTGGVTRYVQEVSKRSKYKIHFVRYADDFIITSNSREFLENKIKPAVVEFLKVRGLSLSEEKTQITHIEDGFDFLGQNVRKYKGKLLTMPSKKSYKAIMKKIREVIEKFKAISAYRLIRILNPIIRGWTNYHRKVISSRTFTKLDNDIFWKILKWTHRRHNNKSKQWIKDKYFKSIGKRDWIFFGEEKGKTATLFQAQSVKICRHLKIKMKANPFDKSWNKYFEIRKREGLDMRLL